MWCGLLVVFETVGDLFVHSQTFPAKQKVTFSRSFPSLAVKRPALQQAQLAQRGEELLSSWDQLAHVVASSAL